MSEWKEYRFKDIYNFSSGLSKPASEFGSGYPFLSFKEVFNNFFLPENLPNLVNSTNKERKSCSIKRGDVFLTRTSETEDELGMSSVALKDYPNATFNGFTKRLRPKDNYPLVSEFVGYYLRTKFFRDQIISMASSTTRASLNNSMLEHLIIIAPKHGEQRAIASVLSSLDDKIDLLHRQNQTLEQMAETLFRQWFVEEADEGWEETTLGELIKIGSGKGLKRDLFSENGLYPVLGANGEIGRTNQYLIDEKIIFTGRVGTLGNVFRVENEKVWLSDNTLVIRPNYYYNFIYFFLKESRLADFDVGSTQPLIRQSDIKEIQVVIPSKILLQEFEIFSDDIFDKIKSNKTQIRTLTALRDTLLPKLMSGEIRVKLSKQD